MSSTSTSETPRFFEINKQDFGPWVARMATLAEGAVGRLTGLRKLENIYARAMSDGDPGSFLDAVLGQMGIDSRTDSQGLNSIPKQGPTIVVANHPFGALEGVVLARHLLCLRPDVKIMANYLLNRVPALRDLFIFVDPFNTASSLEKSLGPLRGAIRWVEKEGLLAIFPAGEVSHLQVKKRGVTDPPWNTVAARIAQKTGAKVVPIYFSGRNSLLFQLLGLAHPVLRTIMLPRELVNKKGKSVHFQVGGPILSNRYDALKNYQEITDYFRLRTYVLKDASHKSKARPKTAGPLNLLAPTTRPVAPSQDYDTVTMDVEGLPPEQTLIVSGDFKVFYAFRRQMPSLTNEIGRLREITFRRVGEGTGCGRDLDSFDDYYLHLCLWNQKENELAGAYRLGPLDDILKNHGIDGLYTSTLFKYQPEFFDQIPGALEMGRSFIVGKYQRSYSALLLLWKGIGTYIMQNPRYRYLFGPVSVSNSYLPLSRRLIVHFVWEHYRYDFQHLVRPRRMVHFGKLKSGPRKSILEKVDSLDELSEVVADIEGNQQGVPILIKQYLKFSAKCTGWNLDVNFNKAMDCLMVADLMETETKTLGRYCGKKPLEAFRALHGDHEHLELKRSA